MTDIELLKWYFGVNTKQAKEYRKQINNKTMEIIKTTFKENAKKTFYED